MMKYLADESLEYPVITLLREYNVEILAVREFMRGASDTEITEYAFKNELIIITSDKDFGELTFRLKKPSCGIILLRLPDSGNTDKANVLLTALKKLDPETKNKFIVIDKLKIRIRSLL